MRINAHHVIPASSTVIPAKAGIFYFFLFCLFLSFIPISFSTPPVSIDLRYDIDKGSLHIEAIHPSFNLEKSYVRLMNIYVNDTQVLTRDYFRQEDYNKFSDDVPLTAQAGDVIKVELFATLGGDLSKEMTVTKPEPMPLGQSAQAQSAESMNSTK